MDKGENAEQPSSPFSNHHMDNGGGGKPLSTIMSCREINDASLETERKDEGELCDF